MLALFILRRLLLFAIIGGPQWFWFSRAFRITARWKPSALTDSRYIWMPLTIGEGNMSLPEPKPWTLDVKSGVAKVLP